MKIEFRNKGFDAINISNRLNHKDAKAATPPYIKNQRPPLLSYSNMPPIATKIFNYREVLQRLNTKDVIGDDPPVFACTSFT